MTIDPKRPFYRILPLLAVSGLLVAALAGCSPLKLVNGLTPNGAERVQAGLAYGDGPRQRLDLFYPEEVREGAPLLVFFYGGSWQNGQRENYRFVGESLAGLGYTVALPDYRVYPEVRFPGFVEDGALALAWLQAHVPEAQNGIVLLGHSAGAHIASLLALDGHYRESAGVGGLPLRGWVGLAGPYTFDPLDYRPTRAVFAGLDDPDQARPVHFACGDRAPALLLHGAADTTVLPMHSEKMAAAMARCGTSVRHRELDGVNHVELLLGLSPTFDGLAEVLPELEPFLRELSAHGAAPTGRTGVAAP